MVNHHEKPHHLGEYSLNKISNPPLKQIQGLQCFFGVQIHLIVGKFMESSSSLQKGKGDISIRNSPKTIWLDIGKQGSQLMLVKLLVHHYHSCWLHTHFWFLTYPSKRWRWFTSIWGIFGGTWMIGIRQVVAGSTPINAKVLGWNKRHVIATGMSLVLSKRIYR